MNDALKQLIDEAMITLKEQELRTECLGVDAFFTELFDYNERDVAEVHEAGVRVKNLISRIDSLLEEIDNIERFGYQKVRQFHSEGTTV